MASTLAQLTARAQGRADQENSQFITNWTDLINNGYKRLYNKLLTIHEEYFIKSYDVTLISGQEDYTLASDFFKLKAVDLLISGSTTNRVTVFPFQWEERNRIRRNNLLAQTAFGTSYRYLLYNINTLKVLPVPAPTTDVFRVWYVPTITPLVSSTDVVLTDPGLDEYIELWAAIQSYQKEESAPSELIQSFKDIEALVIQVATSRKEDQVRKMAVVQDDYADLVGLPINSGEGY